MVTFAQKHARDDSMIVASNQSPMESERVLTEVLVVGAGPTGLALATDLLRHGISVRIIDVADKPSELSRAVVVLPRTIEEFRLRGMHERLLEVSEPVHRFLSYYKDQMVFNVGYEGIHSNFNFLLNVSQCDTEAVLRDELKRLGGEIEWGVSLNSFVDKGDAVQVQLNHPDGVSEVQEVAFMMGADGAHSTVRHGLGIEFKGGAYKDVWLLADVDIAWSLPHGNSYTFFGDDAVLAVFPMPGDRYRLYILQPLERELGRDPTFDDIKVAVERVIPGKCTLSNPGWMSEFHCHHRKVEHYCLPKGRIFLGGDAAHIHSPETGLGMNTGIQDSFNLAWKLARVLRGQAPQSLLGSYDKERSYIGDEVVKFSDITHRMMAQFSPFVRKMRSPILRLFTKYYQRHPADMELGFQLRIQYRASQFIENQGKPEGFHSGPVVKAGVRLPGGQVLPTHARAEVKNAISLYDHFDPCQYQLLVLTGPEITDALCHELRELLGVIAPVRDQIAPVIVSNELADTRLGDMDATLFADPTLEYHYTCGALHGAVYVVRPDGYIGFAGHPVRADAVATYLKKVMKDIN